ncbi:MULTISPECIES: type IV pilin protein [Acinetobacter]|uniref:type IV pilin protein n=1 Tax=Acinetobacter TaxID=469 RepID=UPI001C552685|nr:MULTISPECIES: type IV pilin protein [Acinetobacter]
MEIKAKRGFTLLELVTVVAILGVIAAIAFPSYQNSVRKTKRAEVQAEMAEISSKLQRFKLANFHYVQSTRGGVITPINLTRVGYSSATPNSENGLYQYRLAFNANATEWTLTATPITTGMQKGTGALTLNHAGQQCWYKNKDTFTATDTCLAWSDK